MLQQNVFCTLLTSLSWAIMCFNSKCVCIQSEEKALVFFVYGFKYLYIQQEHQVGADVVTVEIPKHGSRNLSVTYT
jgi:hypothetical protein